MVEEADDTVASLTNVNTFIKQIIHLVMMVINLVYIIVSISAHLTWYCLAIDPKNPTLPRGKKINRPRLLGIMGIVYLVFNEFFYVLVIALFRPTCWAKSKEKCVLMSEDKAGREAQTGGMGSPLSRKYRFSSSLDFATWDFR